MRVRDPWTRLPLRLAELCKPGLSASAAASAAAGFAAGSARLSGELALPFAGVFLLACGACALNQVQDRNRDAAMERTRRRPLPTRSVPASAALAVSLSLLAGGFLILALGGRPVLILAAIAVGWYNGVYAALKRVTAFAAVPGAVAGSLPLAIGWVWAGGGPGQAGLWALCGLFFVWQVPHFWLIVFDHGRDFRRAGLPSLADVFSGPQIRRLVAQWTLGTSAFALLLSIGGVVRTPPAKAALAVLSVWLGAAAVRFASGRARTGDILFRQMNFFILAVIALICLDGLGAVGPG